MEVFCDSIFLSIVYKDYLHLYAKSDKELEISWWVVFLYLIAPIVVPIKWFSCLQSGPNEGIKSRLEYIIPRPWEKNQTIFLLIIMIQYYWKRRQIQIFTSKDRRQIKICFFRVPRESGRDYTRSLTRIRRTSILRIVWTYEPISNRYHGRN